MSSSNKRPRTTKKPNEISWQQIITGLIAAAAVIIPAYFVYQQTIAPIALPLAATQTAEARQIIATIGSATTIPTPSISNSSLNNTGVPIVPTISSVEPLLNEQRFISSFINNINGDIGELEAEIPWWDPETPPWGDVNALRDPGGCYGLAWNTANRQNELLVFRRPVDLEFTPGQGGFSQKVCISGSDIPVSAEDIGEIQRTWLTKRYGVTWKVTILE